MFPERWIRRISCALLFSMLFQTVLPAATAWTIQQTREQVAQQTREQANDTETTTAETDQALDLLQQAEQWLSPSALAAGEIPERPTTTVLNAPPCHDKPGDTNAQGGGGSGNGSTIDCSQYQGGNSEIQYINRALGLGETLGAAGLPLIASFNSRYETTSIPLASWMPMINPVDSWQISIQGWTFQGKGARALGFWDTTDKQTQKPVPSGIYFAEVTYADKTGKGSTMHAVVVRRIEDGPLGYGWSHNFETRLEKVDNNHLLLKTFNIWMVFTKDTGTSKEIYSTPSSPDDKLTRQPDGTWQWERTGADGSPVNGTLTFDAQGRLTGFQDRLGNATKLDYDAQGRLASVTDSAGRTTRLAYDGNHIAKVTDAAGASWTLSYQSGNLVQIINPLGYRASFEYDNAHRVVRRTDMRGNVTQYAYDQEGGVTLVTDAAGNTVSYETVDNTEPMLSENPSKTPPILGTTTIIYRTPDGNETSRYLNTFNDMGEVVRKEQSSDGGKTNTTWQYEWGTDRPGELVAITDPKGNKTTLSYSGDTGLLRQVKLPGRDTVDLTHTRSAKSGFRTASFERGSDAKIEVRYDELGRPRNVQQGDLQYWLEYADSTGGPRGLVSAMIWNWDGKGDPKSAPDAKIIRYTYDARGQATSITDPLGRKITFTYDPAGRLSEFRDALGRPTTFEQDLLGRVVRRTDAAGGVTRYTYDESDNITAIVDARGNKTTFAYDYKNRLIEQRDPLGRTTHFGYDNHGRKIWREDARGARVEFVYDDAGRTAQVVFPTGETWNGTIDSTGQFTQTANAASAWSYDYNPSGQVSKAQFNRGGGTATLDYRYDRDGRLGNVSASNGSNLAFVYDAYGNLTRVTNPMGTVEYTYTVKGQFKPMLTGVKSGQLVETRAYDAVGRLTELSFKHLRWTANQVVQLRYTYDAADNVVAIQDASGTTKYEYDALDQLVGVTYPDGKKVSYAYDAVGNRTKMVAPTETVEYTYDAANQIISAGATRYYHDSNGDMIGAWQGERGRVYAWDYQGYLRGIDDRTTEELPYPLSLVEGQPATPLARYSYDAQGRQTESHPSAAAVQSAVRTVPGAGIDEVRAWTQTTYRDAIYPMADRLGTIVGAVDAQGQTLYQARYDPWGVPQQRGTDNPLPGFQGRPYDAATGLYDFRARFYDPALGRFLSPDPSPDYRVPSSLNGYSFGQNNPLRYRDPSGRFWLELATIAFVLSYNISYYFFSTPSDCWTLEDFLVNVSTGVIKDMSTLVLAEALGPLGAIAGAMAGEYLQTLIIDMMWKGQSPSEIDWGEVSQDALKEGLVAAMTAGLEAKFPELENVPGAADSIATMLETAFGDTLDWLSEHPDQIGTGFDCKGTPTIKSFTSSATMVQYNGSVQLDWLVSNANYVDLDATSGTDSLQGPATITNLTDTREFTLVAKCNDGTGTPGQVKRTITVGVAMLEINMTTPTTSRKMVGTTLDLYTDFTILVTNKSDRDITGVVVTDALPNGLVTTLAGNEWNIVSSASHGTCTKATNREWFVCNISVIPQGQQARMNLVARRQTNAAMNNCVDVKWDGMPTIVYQGKEVLPLSCVTVPEWRP